MLFCVKACCLCVSISVTGGEESWEELARVEVVRRFEMSWERGEMSWAEVRSGGKSWGGGKRWEELRQVEKSEGKVGRGESRWEELRRAGKRWKELSWEGEGWNNFEPVEKSCKNWDELRWSEKSWEVVVTIEKGWRKMTANSENRVAKLWDFTAAPIGQTFWGPIVVRFLELETSADRLARDPTCITLFLEHNIGAITGKSVKTR